MNFACEMMDLCRGTQEVEAVLCSALDEEEGGGVVDPLRRLRLAIRYEEKKVTFLYYENAVLFHMVISVLPKNLLSIPCKNVL